MVNGHTYISASNASRWTRCTASAELTKNIESFDTDYSTEGTEAHGIAAKMLSYMLLEAENPLPSIEKEEAKQLMARYAIEYGDWIKEILPNKSEIFIEKRVSFTDTVAGTCDCAIISQNEIIIIDYKYGQGLLVPAVDNLQLVFYALGFRKSYGRKDKYKLYIYQPRTQDDEPYSLWELEDHELDLYEELFNNAISEIEQGKFIFRTGKHCQFCPAKPRCPEWNEELQVIEKSKKDFPSPELLPEDVAEAVHLRGEEVIKWIQSVMKYNLAKACNGSRFTNLKLVEGRSFRKWDDMQEGDIVSQVNMYNLEPYKKTLVPFSHVEKHLGKKKFEESFGHLVVKPKGKPKLVSRSAKGEEISLSGGYEFNDLFLDGEEYE